MAVFSFICSGVLAVYLCYESAISLKHYQRLKSDIGAGDQGARLRFYGKILTFEWVSTALAFAGLEFDFARLTPAGLGLSETAFGRFTASAWSQAGSEFLSGIGAGIVVSWVGAFLVIWLIRRRSRLANQSSSDSGRARIFAALRRLMPDLGALIPTTPRERIVFALVAISAGICEEVVFRAWLLDVLHNYAGVSGYALVGVAAAVFGLAHYYQGMLGVVFTGVLGLLFCGLYFASGTLLLPIALHAIIDLRVTVMPTMQPTAEKRPSAGLL